MVDIAEIRDDVIVLKNGSLRMIMEISSINFELRSEDEQRAILQNFQSFLNSLDFPLEIVVNSRRFNVDTYLESVNQASADLTNELLKVQAEEYMNFVRELATLSNIMSKHFYIVIPYYVMEAPTRKGFLDGLKNLFGLSGAPAPLSDEKFAAYRGQLSQRAELVFNGVVTAGLHATILKQDGLRELFSSLYNPGVTSAIT